VPNTIKIDRYNFELYHFKVGPFFETQCTTTDTANTISYDRLKSRKDYW